MHKCLSFLFSALMFGGALASTLILIPGSAGALAKPNLLLVAEQGDVKAQLILWIW